MANIIIKKKVELDFLGEDYKEGYLVFRAAGIDELSRIEEEADKAEDNLAFIKDFLNSKFLEGKFPDVDNKNELQDVGKEDIGKFDPETILAIFQVLGGGIVANPKGSSN